MHLFKFGKSLPSTEYGIFEGLILNCIVRYYEKEDNGLSNVKSLNNLPVKDQEPFDYLCKVAYDGVQNGTIIFDENDLEPNFKSLGLLHGEESSAEYAKSRSYHFLHLSIQEVLAAKFMATKLRHKEQNTVKEFEKLFDQPRFYAVFRYFAAITKLENPEIKKFVLQVAKNQIKTRGKDKSRDSMFGYTPQPQFVTLIHCLFEAHDSDLCKEVVQQLDSELNLDGTSLNSTDCLSLGYFLTYCQQFHVSLAGCSIDGKGCKMLFRQRNYDFQGLKYVITTRLQ